MSLKPLFPKNKSSERIRVLKNGVQVGSVTLAEALHRIRNGSARAAEVKKNRLRAIAYPYVEHANTGSNSLVGQKYTFRHETASNPPRVLTLKRLTANGQLVDY